MILSENKIYVWHGGKRLEGSPEIRSHKEGKYEAGPGFYTTTKYSTASKYAKGGGATFLLEISPFIKLANTVVIPLNSAIDFVKNCSGMKNKTKLIDDLLILYENKKLIADNFINLIVNWKAGAGKVGISIAAFLTANGVDASLDNKSSTEDWLVIYNPKIIKEIKKIPAKNVTDDLYILPKISTYN